MRRELNEFYRLPLDEQKPASPMERWHHALSLRVLQMRIRGVSAGSQEWHWWQHRISLEAPVGLGMEKRTLFYRLTLPQWGEKLYVLPHVSFHYPLNINLGENVFVNRGALITARGPITIGNHVLIGPNVVINSGSHNYADSKILIRDQGHKIAPIQISDDVWIGAHAVVLPGVTIGKGAVVAAGAVVTRSVAPFSVVGGIPARLLKGRD